MDDTHEAGDTADRSGNKRILEVLDRATVAREEAALGATTSDGFRMADFESTSPTTSTTSRFGPGPSGEFPFASFSRWYMWVGFLVGACASKIVSLVSLITLVA